MGGVSAIRVTALGEATAVHVSTRSMVRRARSATPVAGCSSARASCRRLVTSAARRVVSSIAASSSVEDCAGSRLCRLSRRRRNAVSGVRSWWEASATNVRWLRSSSSRRRAIVDIVSASARTSGGPLIGSVLTVRSPPAKREASLLSRRIGRVTDLAIPHPTTATTTRTTAAIPASDLQNRCIRALTSLVSRVTRTAPWTTPPDATGTAT